ncbi:hypothetical protein WJX73_003667 [Symbiochloris irregularis]|uniref:Uncharacterized protein n=1 Tax=Symbiochloris irregularis TaxID=706552 RepID=A0AAW1PPB2_9CHLO
MAWLVRAWPQRAVLPVLKSSAPFGQQTQLRALSGTFRDASGLGDDDPGPAQPPENEPPPDPPSAFTTVGAMILGAFGAVGVAGLGVWGVFTLAQAVAKSAGRSMAPTPEEEQQQQQQQQKASSA